MSPLPSRLPVGSVHPDQVVYIAENERDAEILASELDCQIVYQPKTEISALVSEALKHLDAQMSEYPKRFKHRDASDVSL